MVQRGQQPRLALETNTPLGIGREEMWEDFDRDIAPSCRSRARYTSPMPPTPSGRKHFVMGEALPDRPRGSGGVGQRWCRHETSRLAMSSQKRLHFTQQVSITSAAILEERRLLLFRHRERRVIELTDPSVPFRRHH
jgi:hypothetical protein